MNKEEFQQLKQLAIITAYSTVPITLTGTEMAYIHEIINDYEELKEMYLKLDSDRFWNNAVSKNKIKAKIKELEKIKENVKTKYPSTYTLIDSWRDADAQIEVLQLLLEEKE